MIQSLSAIFLFLYIIYYFLFRKPRNFPPGPPSIPIVGSYPFLPNVKGVTAFASDWITSRYGKLVGMYLGPYRAVCVYDYDIAKEMFSKEEASGRPDIFVYNHRMLNKRLGVLFNDSDEYRNQRRFIHRTLKDFGFGKASLENILLEEADQIVEHFNGLRGSPVQPGLIFNVGVLNILWKIVADKRYSLTDERMMRLFSLLNSTTRLDSQKLLLMFPFLRFLLPGATGWERQKQIMKDLHLLMAGIVDQHKKTHDEDSMRTFIDVYIKQIETSGDPAYNEEQLIVILMDLFTAGAETTSTTLTWALINLINYPEVQKKIHDEIDNVLGNNQPTSEYKGRLLYTEAVLLETLRYNCIVPFSVTHRAKETFKIRGYTIPKDTTLYPILRHMMRDPAYWEKPEEFNPERFLRTDKDGNTSLIKEERLVPFGIGKRVCLGETLARQELFLIFAKLMQAFQVQASEDNEPPSEGRARANSFAITILCKTDTTKGNHLNIETLFSMF